MITDTEVVIILFLALVVGFFASRLGLALYN